MWDFVLPITVHLLISNRQNPFTGSVQQTTNNIKKLQHSVLNGPAEGSCRIGNHSEMRDLKEQITSFKLNLEWFPEKWSWRFPLLEDASQECFEGLLVCGFAEMFGDYLNPHWEMVDFPMWMDRLATDPQNDQCVRHVNVPFQKFFFAWSFYLKSEFFNIIIRLHFLTLTRTWEEIRLVFLSKQLW